MTATDHTENPALTSRRALLAAGAVAATGATLVASPDRALANHTVTDELDFDGFVNVTKSPFLANHTNSGNAAPGIQAAIAAAHSSGTGTATVYFPPGVYRCDAQITVPANTRLVGHGRLSVLRAGSGNSGHLVAAAGSDTISIEDLTLDGRTVESNSWSSTHSGSLVAILGASTSSPAKDISLRKLHVLGTQAGSYTAILLANVKNGVVHDCLLEDCSGGAIVFQQRCEDCAVQGSIVQGCKGDNIGLHPIAGGPVPARIAILHSSFDTGGTVTSSSATGVSVRGGKGVAIVGNTFRGGRLASIELATNSGDIEDVEIAANVLTESGKVAIESLHTGAGTAVALTAFGTNRSIRRVSIKDNAIRDPRCHGISLYSSAETTGITDVSITCNVIVMGGTDNINGTNGIRVTPAGPVENLLVASNDIRASRGSSIEVRGATVKRLDVSENQMADTPSGPPAIQVSNVGEVSVTGNRASGAHNPGLKLDGITGDAIVARNNLTESSASSGFKPVDAVSMSGVRRLRIRDNPGFNPWTGERDIDGSGSDRSLRVPPGSASLPVPFPTSAGVPKVKIFATPLGDLQAYVSVSSVQADNFTLRIILPGSVPSGSKISWIAEPFD